MDAAEVADEHVVDVHPHVVVAGEVVGDGRGLRFVDVAAVLLDEPGGHAHAEVVVDDGTDGGHAVALQRAAGHVEYLRARVEREELAVGRGTARVHAACVVQGERVGRLVELGEVRLTVVGVIALVVDLEQTGDAGERLFARAAGVGEQVGERFAAEGCGECRVAVRAERGGRDGGAWMGAGRPLVDVAGVGLVGGGGTAGVFVEVEDVTRVDAEVGDAGGVDVVGCATVGEPVVEEVDGGAARCDAVHGVGGEWIVRCARREGRCRQGHRDGDDDGGQIADATGLMPGGDDAHGGSFR